MVRKEVLVVENLVYKVSQRFPGLFPLAKNEYLEKTGMELSTPSQTQYFIGWMFLDYMLPGGKRLIPLIRQTIDLAADEQSFLQALDDAVVGFFEILRWGKTVKVKDLMTGLEYKVYIDDMQRPSVTFISARLVKRFDGEYFFFGGILCLREEDKEDVEKVFNTFLE